MWTLFHPVADVVIFICALAVSILIGKLGSSGRRSAVPFLERLAFHPARCCLFIATVAFVGSAIVSLTGKFPEPRVHDEFSYLLAADTFANGRLTNPTHPQWLSFESMHILQKPTYASRYPPAQGLIMAAGQVVGGHPMVGVWLSAALGSGAICWMLMGWLPPHWALYGSLLAVLRLGIGGYWSQSYFGGWVAAIGGALLLGGLRRTIERPRISSSLVMALGLVILANSRPLEGAIIALPCAVLILGFVVRRTWFGNRDTLTRIVAPVCLVLIVTALWIGYYNQSVTGDPLKMPHQLYSETYMTAPYFLFSEPRPQPRYRNAAIARFHKHWEQRVFKAQLSFAGWLEHRIAAFSGLWKFYLGVALGIPLLLLFSSRSDPWLLFAVFLWLLYLGLTLVMTWNMPHYSALLAPLVFYLVVQGVRVALSSDRWHSIGQHLFRILPLYCLGSLAYGLVSPQDLFAWPHDSDFQARRAQTLEELEVEGGRHLILVRYGKNHRVHDEWVYNGADIDSAQVVWARAMHPARNRRLLSHFHDREAWLFEPDNPEARLQPFPRESPSR